MNRISRTRWAFEPVGFIGWVMSGANWFLMRTGWAVGFGPEYRDGTPVPNSRNFSVVRWP